MRQVKTNSRRVALVAGLLLNGLLFGAACSSGTEQAPAAPGVTVYEGARVIVGDGSAPIENAVFVVQDDRFVQVGRAGDVQVPAGAARVDLAGKTVMPAIVDTHTHLESMSRESLVNHLQRKAYYGVGAAMSLGQDTTDAAFQVREETVPGAARFKTAGRGITAPEPGRTTAPYWVSNEAEARKAVQELAAKKVDFVKIWVDDRDDMFKKLTPALYGAIIDEAHKNGLRVTAHIFELEDAKGLLKAGVDAFAHSVRDKDIDQEFMTLMKEHPQVAVDPNLPARGVATDLSWLNDSVQADELKKAQEAVAKDNPQQQQAYGIQARNLAKLSAAGVPIVLGTDGGVPWAHHLEMEDMVAAGMTPAQVITASTKAAAEFMRMPDIGSIEQGKSADFIVLDANPLDDIKNTRRINAVYLRGTAIDRAAMRARMTGRTTE